MKVKNTSARAYFIGDYQLLPGQIAEVNDSIKSTRGFQYAVNKGELVEVTSGKVTATQKAVKEEKPTSLDDKK